MKFKSLCCALGIHIVWLSPTGVSTRRGRIYIRGCLHCHAAWVAERGFDANHFDQFGHWTRLKNPDQIQAKEQLRTLFPL